MSDDFKPHLFIKNVHSSQEYTTPPGPPIDSKLPQRDRQFHGEFLISSLIEIWSNHDEEVLQRNKKGLPVKSGEYITFFGAEKQILEIEKIGYDKLPICMAKTQYSLTDDQTKLGRPTGFKITVRNIKVSAGAGFLVALTGEIMTMPGLPKAPAAEKIDVDSTGKIAGLF